RVGDRDRVHDARQHHHHRGAEQDAELAPRYQVFRFELDLVVVKMILIAHIRSSSTPDCAPDPPASGDTLYRFTPRARPGRLRQKAAPPTSPFIAARSFSSPGDSRPPRPSP